MLDIIGEKTGGCPCDSVTCKQSQPLAGSKTWTSIHCISSTGTRKSLRTGFSHKLQRNLQRHKRRILMGCIGLFLVILALTIFLLDPLERIIAWQTSVVDGTVVFKFWQKPPVTVLLSVYMFNVTNPQEFLEGREKLRLQEVGPFVYRELYENTNPKFNPNGTVTFIPKRSLKFERDLSVASPTTSYFTLPNIPFLGAASMLHSSSIFTNLGLRSLTTYLDSQPFLNLSVHDILLGYDDPLVQIAHSVLPSFVGFKSFGILDRMYSQSEEGEIASMKAGYNAGLDPNDPDPWLHDVFSLDTYNGSPGLPQWGYGKKLVHDPVTNKSVPEELPCNMVRGSLEGFMFPRGMTSGSKFYVYRRAFCRTFPALFESEGVGPGGYRALWYKLDKNSMDPLADQNSCFCDKKNEQCPPLGTSDISPCYYNIPLTLSMPHFLNGDRRLVDAVEGLNPLPEHESYLVVQPDLGIPLSIRCKIQVNLVIKKTKLHPKVAPFNDLILPILWIDFNVKDLPFHIELLMTLALYVGPVLQTSFTVLLAIVGSIMLLTAVFKNKNHQFYSSVVVEDSVEIDHDK
ncbi:scavenger receptor class B member 1 [Anabrus simplex]|uniref:scavenger receptor class B member 1 n=1 Tax=Anabrus simplex TaxID=316456 RepID=UPI0035A3290D